jgi:hypothetical protein
MGKESQDRGPHHVRTNYVLLDCAARGDSTRVSLERGQSSMNLLLDTLTVLLCSSSIFDNPTHQPSGFSVKLQRFSVEVVDHPQLLSLLTKEIDYCFVRLGILIQKKKVRKDTEDVNAQRIPPLLRIARVPSHSTMVER